MSLIPSRIETGVDGRLYVVFDSEQEADDSEEAYGLEAPRYCFDGYMNAFLFDEFFKEELDDLRSADQQADAAV